MPEDLVLEGISFLEFLDDLPGFTWHLGHHIMPMRIDFFAN